jgi:hypothetical protein
MAGVRAAVLGFHVHCDSESGEGTQPGSCWSRTKYKTLLYRPYSQANGRTVAASLPLSGVWNYTQRKNIYNSIVTLYIHIGSSREEVKKDFTETKPLSMALSSKGATVTCSTFECIGLPLVQCIVS